MDLAGSVLGNRYELGALLATGGMGQVWRARDVVLERPVAVKLLRSEYTDDPGFLARFRAEARLTAGLTAPSIATLHDYGETTGPGGQRLAYLVMELVDGEPLSAVLAREGRLSPERTRDVLRQAAAGLAVAHGAGVVHRDVKPANLLVAADGTVKITDFGIAWSASSASITRTGQVIGTVRYLSPEQAQGAKATPASDVYALGVVAYECLTGRRAFDGDNALHVVAQKVSQRLGPLPPDVPPDLRRVVERALATDPADRIPDGAALLDALDGGAPERERTRVLATAGAAPVTRVLPSGPGGRPARRLLVPLVALLVLAVVVGAVVLDTRGTSSPTAEPTPSPSAPAGVEVASGDYVGRPVSEVVDELGGLGLTVRPRPLQTGDVPAGQVIALDPLGALQPGDTVTVTHAVAPPAPSSAPAEEPDEDEADPDEEGSGNGNAGGGNGNEGNQGNGNGKGGDKKDGKKD
ncbi:serine/threonine protein kinase [Geodermatophilus sp. SYSU D01105]